MKHKAIIHDPFFDRDSLLEQVIVRQACRADNDSAEQTATAQVRLGLTVLGLICGAATGALLFLL